MSTKRTYQPSKFKRAKKLGFRKRNSTKKGRKIIKRRRFVGRKRVTLWKMFARKFSIPRKEFTPIKKEGKLVQNNSFGALIRKREMLGNPRFSVVISNKVMKLSTHRNRIRRSFRDTLRRNWKKVDDGLDMIFLVKPGIEKLPVSEIMKEIESFSK